MYATKDLLRAAARENAAAEGSDTLDDADAATFLPTNRFVSDARGPAGRSRRCAGADAPPTGVDELRRALADVVAWLDVRCACGAVCARRRRGALRLS